MPVDQFSCRLNPYRANYNALYPTGECRWESFTQNIVCGIEVGVDQVSRMLQRAITMARLTAIVVFPVPPFGEVTTIFLYILPKRLWGVSNCRSWLITRRHWFQIAF
jgi:hypothetical protein